jgi:hypothetical protein
MRTKTKEQSFLNEKRIERFRIQKKLYEKQNKEGSKEIQTKKI